MRFTMAVSMLGAGFALGACSGGTGSILTNDHTNAHVIVGTGATENLPRVLAGSSLALSAVLVAGSGDAVVNRSRFTWSADVSAGMRYPSDAFGGTAPCATLLAMSSGGSEPYTPDFSVFVTIDPSNEANIIFSPPLVVPAPSGASVVATYPYCVTVTAQAVAGASARGSAVVAVFDPQAPLGPAALLLGGRP